MEIVTELFLSLIKTSPIFVMLSVAIAYFYKENKGLKEEIKELNNYVRDESIKNVKVLETVSNTLEKVVNEQDSTLDRMKEFIERMFLKNNLKGDD